MSTHSFVRAYLRVVCLAVLSAAVVLSSGACLIGRGAALATAGPTTPPTSPPESRLPLTPTAGPQPALVAPAPPPQTAPIQLEVLSYTIYPWADTALKAVGEVQNRGPQPVGDVTVSMALLDAGSQELASGEAMIAGSISPGAKRAFTVDLQGAPQAPKEWTKVRFQTGGRAVDPNEPSQEYLDFRIDDLTVRERNDQYFVAEGKLTNTGGKVSQSPVAWITAYDATGKVIDVASGGASAPLEPGQSMGFSALLEHLKALPASYSAMAWGVLLPGGEAPAGPAPAESTKLEVVSSQTYADPQSNSLAIVGEVANRGAAPAIGVEVHATVLDASGTVLATTGQNSVGHAALPPGETWPFVLGMNLPQAPYDKIQLEVSGRAPEATETSPFTRDFQIDGVSAAAPDAWHKFGLLGLVKNTGAQRAEQVAVCAVEYDAAGHVLDVGSVHPEVDRLSPGGSAPFDLRFDHLKAAPQNYKLFVDGWLSQGPETKVEVASYVAYQDAAGRLEVLGEVANTGDVAARMANVAVTLLGADGKPVAVDGSGLGYLAPGEWDTFTSLVTLPKQGYKDLRLDVGGEPDMGGPPADRYTDLTITQVRVGKSTSQANTYTAIGRVKNTGRETVKNALVKGIVRDAAGRLTDLNSVRTETGALKSGDEAPFALQFQHTGAPPAKVDYRAAGELVTPHTPTPPATPTMPVPTATPTPEPAAMGQLAVASYSQYVDPAGKWVFVGEVKNSGPSTVGNVVVTVTLLDAAGQVAGAGAGHIKHTIYPGASLPFAFTMDPPKGEVKQMVFAVTGEPDESGSESSNLPTTSNLKQDPATGKWSLTGTVKNNSDGPIQELELIVAAREKDNGDDPGKVLDVAIGYPEQRNLPAFGASPFKLTFDHLTTHPAVISTSGRARYGPPTEAAVAMAGETPSAGAPTTPTSASVRIEEAQPTFTPIPSPTSTPKPEIKLAVRSYRSPDQGVSWIGEVENVGDAPTSFWQVALTLLDEAGNPLMSLNSNSGGWRLAPGDRAPFELSFRTVSANGQSVTSNTLMPAKWASVRVQAQGEPDSPSTDRYLDLTLEQVSLTREATFNKYRLSGFVKNAGQKLTLGVGLMATGYDASGQVLDVATGIAQTQGLPPGGSAPFQLDFPRTDVAPVSYTIQAQSAAAWDQPAATLPAPAAEVTSAAAAQPPLEATHYTIKQDPNYVEIVGEVINRGEVAVTDPEVTVTLLDAKGIVVATQRGRSGPYLAPGKKLPFRVMLDGAAQGSWKDVRLTVQGQPAQPNSEYYSYPGMQAVDVRGNTDRSGFTLTGRLSNSGDQPATANAYGLAYDGAGQVIDQGEASTTDPIQPGAAVPFQLVFHQLEGTAPVTWTLNVLAHVDWMARLKQGPTPAAQSQAPANPEPTPGQAAVRAPYPTPNPNASVRVVNYSIQGGKPDALRVCGEVLNAGSEPLRQALLTVAVLDEGGRDIFNQMATVNGLIAPGERMPFDVQLTGAPDSGWKDVAIDAYGEPAVAGERNLFGYRDFKISRVNFTRTLDGSGKLIGYMLSGAVSNVGTKAVTLNLAKVALYDGSGRVVGVGDLKLALNRLERGQETAFQLLLGGAAGPSPKYSIVVRGYAE
jgi:hypothetical protein